MEIGEFQLRQLLSQDIGFLYFYLGELPEAAGLELYTRRLEPLPPSTAYESIVEKAADKSHPIILICEQGLLSNELAKALNDEDYLNVYWVEGGWVGLRNLTLD